jgi:hypothetical protein
MASGLSPGQSWPAGGPIHVTVLREGGRDHTHTGEDSKPSLISVRPAHLLNHIPRRDLLTSPCFAARRRRTSRCHFCSSPRTVVLVIAGHRTEDLRHQARGHQIVGPDAAIHQLAGRGEIFRTVENLGCNPHHAADEARKVLRFRLQRWRARARRVARPREENGL